MLNSQYSIFNDQSYVGLPFLSNGRTRSGLDCAGLAHLWLREQANLPLPPLKPDPTADAASLLPSFPSFSPALLCRGDTIFFRHRRTNKICHVAIYLGDNKLLHIIAGLTSRIENGFTLLARLGMEPVAAIPPTDAERLCRALADPNLGWTTIIMLAIAIILSVVSGFLLRPSANAFKNITGKYGQTNTGLLTAKDPQIPLPDILGVITVAGNSVYQQLPEKSATVSDSPPQAWNQVVVLQSAPSSNLDASLQINGLSYQDKNWHAGANVTGILLNPPQDKTTVTGSLSGDTYVPSITLYPGAPATRLSTDIRAYYDRTFPVYPMAGATYIAARWFDSTKFASVNITAEISGRLCRDFNASGFITATATAESLPNSGSGKVRFKLTYDDVIAVTSLTVNGTAHTLLSPTNQSGNIYALNKTKGYVEFMTAPAAGSTILVTYTYYPRTFTQNPAHHIIYLLTEPRRGKALDPDRIDWPSAHAARQYYDESVTWITPDGKFTSPRYETNYSIDVRKPIQDHIQVLLDACHSCLFLSAGKFILLPVKTGSSVFSFDPTNILLDSSGKSTFRATLQDRAPKANRVRLDFHSAYTLNGETEVVADDEDNQLARSGRAGDSGVVEEQLKFPAVTAPDQAERLAETLLREHVASNWLYEWKTNIQGLALQPGDIIDLTHPSQPGTKLLRLESLEFDENDLLKLTASEYVPDAYI